MRQAAFTAIKEKKYLTEEELRRFEEGIGKGKVQGTVAACPEGSLAWNQSLVRQEGGQVPGVEPGEYEHQCDPGDHCTLIALQRELIIRGDIHPQPDSNL